MLNRENFLQSVKDEDRMLVSKVIDKLEVAEKRKIFTYTNFLDLYQQKIIERILKSLKANFKVDGGYTGAERKMVVFLPENKSEFYSLPIDVFNITYLGKMFGNITHRDILGSVMSLGIKWGKIGDIITGEESCKMIVYRDISDFIICNFVKIKNTNINLKIDDIKTIKPPQQKFLQITGFIPSLRLDCIIEEGFTIPRSEAVQLIKGEKVFVNWEMISKPSFELQVNDTVSVRGMGRLIFEEVCGKTKKERLVVKIKRII